MAYTRYVLDCGIQGDILDLLVAMAPCIVGYGEIGMNLKSNSIDQASCNPFQEWIDTYSSENFQEGVNKLKERINQLEQQNGVSDHRFAKLCQIFQGSVRLETKFWEMSQSCTF